MNFKTFCISSLLLFSVFFSSPKHADAMQVSIQPTATSSFTIEVEPSDSIENVKAKIQDKLGTPPESQRLVYGQSSIRMEEGRTLSDYNVQASNTINFVELTNGRAAFTFNVSPTFATSTCTWVGQFTNCSLYSALLISSRGYFDDATIRLAPGTYATTTQATYQAGYDTQSLHIVGSGAASTKIQNTNATATIALWITAKGPIAMEGVTVTSLGSIGTLIEDYVQQGVGRMDIDIHDTAFETNGNGGLSLANYGSVGSATVRNNSFISNRVGDKEGAGFRSDAAGIFPVTVSGNTFTNNVATSGYAGGALWIDTNGPNSPVVISDNVITGNTASEGAGMYIFANSGLTIRNNTITGNIATNAGSAMRIYIDTGDQNTSDNYVENNRISNNVGSYPYYIYQHARSSFSMKGNVISNNVSNSSAGQLLFLLATPKTISISSNVLYGNRSAETGAAMNIYGSDINTINVVNNTFADNIATAGASGLAVTMSPGDTWNVFNNIFYNARNDIGLTATSGSVFNFKYNNANFATTSSIVSSVSNLNLNPLFVNAVGGDYRLTASSPLLNVGYASAPSLPSLDALGAARVSGTAPDLGAYETQVVASNINRVSGGGSGYVPEAPIAPKVEEKVEEVKPKLAFTKILKNGMTDPDVKKLQQFLNAHGFVIAKSGVGSKGNESLYFGQKTKVALARFQQANKIKGESGVFGQATMAVVNGMIR